MYDIIYVNTREELVDAITVSFDYIVITNKKLARNVEFVLFASKAVLSVAIITAVVGAAIWWDDIGMTADTFLVLLKITFLFFAALLIVVFGISVLWSSSKKLMIKGAINRRLLSVLWSLSKDWKIRDKLKSTLPNGTTIEGEIILE